MQLICSLRNIDDVCTVIPLRLSGSAFDIYAQLPDADKKVLDKVKKGLTKAFSIDVYSAYVNSHRDDSGRMKMLTHIWPIYGDCRHYSGAFRTWFYSALLCPDYRKRSDYR